MNFGWNCTSWKAFRILVARLRRVCRNCFLHNLVAELNPGHLPSIEQHVNTHLRLLGLHQFHVSVLLPFWGSVGESRKKEWQSAMFEWRESLLTAKENLKNLRENASSNGDALLSSDAVERVKKEVHQALEVVMDRLADLHSELKEDEKDSGLHSPGSQASSEGQSPIDSAESSD